MKICVLGAGVIGVSTALMLARDGHEVHVIEKASTIATGASAANGAQLSYSYVDPFASPATLRQLPAYLSGLDPAVRLGLSVSPSYLSWGLKFIRECASERFRENMLSRVRLACRSEEGLRIFENECGGNLLYPTGRGKIVLADSTDKLQQMKTAAESKKTLGIESRVLSKVECLAAEPALAHWQGQWVGGVYAEQDIALDPQTYCQALMTAAEMRYGVKFHFEEEVRSLQISGDAIWAVETNQSLHLCEHAVLCLGPQANSMLNDMGLSVPIYPVQGYSLTLPATPEAPATSITDLKHKVVFANLGDSIRIAGFMDTNQSPGKARKRGEQLHSIARKLWPSIANYDAGPEHWTDFRPMVPSGVPIIKQSKLSGLYLNIGHGSLGYTFAAGSAMVIADLIGQDSSEYKNTMERTHYA